MGVAINGATVVVSPSGGAVAVIPGSVGSIPVSMIPTIAISDPHVVADAAARLALESATPPVETGEWVVQTDDSTWWLYDDGTFLQVPVLTAAQASALDTLASDLAARLKVDGSVAMTGDLDVGGHAVTSVGQVGALVPTPAGVKALYEGNSNTNAFTDADSAKLVGVEAGATSDQTGAEIVSAIDAELGAADWQTGGGGAGGDVVADSLVVNGLVRTKAVALTGPDEITGEAGVIYYADLRTGDVNILAPDLPQTGDTLRGEVIAIGTGVLTLCGVTVSSAGGAVQRFPSAAGVPAVWRLAGDAP